MATEEDDKSSSLPPYPEMIMEALEGLDEPNGSNKSAISEYIESTYGELPAGHTTLLNYHLNKMKDGGELVILKNNYMKPGPNAPPKRGRGRPPKPKEEKVPPRTVLSPPRPRGRPPKDPNAPPKSPKAKPSGGSGRPRGRPKKIPRTVAAPPSPPPSSAPPPTSTPNRGTSTPNRGRGRPPKVKPELTEVSVET